MHVIWSNLLLPEMIQRYHYRLEPFGVETWHKRFGLHMQRCREERVAMCKRWPKCCTSNMMYHWWCHPWPEACTVRMKRDEIRKSRVMDGLVGQNCLSASSGGRRITSRDSNENVHHRLQERTESTSLWVTEATVTCSSLMWKGQKVMKMNDFLVLLDGIRIACISTISFGLSSIAGSILCSLDKWMCFAFKGNSLDE